MVGVVRLGHERDLRDKERSASSEPVATRSLATIRRVATKGGITKNVVGSDSTTTIGDEDARYAESFDS